MAIVRKGGTSGKECQMCRTWKPLYDFNPANKPGMFKGYMKDICKECERLMKQKGKKNV